MSYIIACSSSKNNPINFQNFESSIDNLSFPYFNEYRLELIENLGVNLDWSHTLPAWKLYSGPGSRLYPRIDEDNWLKPCIGIKIASALFGMVKHTDLLPYYDVTMMDRIANNNQKIYQFWAQNINWVDFINDNDVNLLSLDYKLAINHHGNNLGIIPNFNFGIGYQNLYNKGVWLNEQLTNLICN